MTLITHHYLLITGKATDNNTYVDDLGSSNSPSANTWIGVNVGINDIGSPFNYFYASNEITTFQGAVFPNVTSITIEQECP